MVKLRNILFDESGQGLIEYSLILSLVTITAIGAVFLFGESVHDLYEAIKEKVTNAL